MIPLARPELTKDEIQEVVEVLQSGQLASGKWVTQFESAFADYHHSPHAIAVSNGTTALHTALLSCGIGPGDKVLTTPFTFIASANSIRHAGAWPVFADIDPKSMNLSPTSARELLTRNRDIKAILLVHLYGHPCDMDSFRALKEDFDVLLIEDCAQAHGALYKGQKVGTFGDAAAFSFYATKNLMTGEGGMVITKIGKVADAARKIINHGRSGQYTHDIVGYNYRMTNITAAIGLSQLAKLDENNLQRQTIAQRYITALKDQASVSLPQVDKDCRHAFHQFTVLCSDRNLCKTHLEKCGVSSSIVYPKSICEQAAYQSFYHTPGGLDCSCSQTRTLAEKVLSIPVFPSLSDEEQGTVIESILSFGRHNQATAA